MIKRKLLWVMPYIIYFCLGMVISHCVSKAKAQNYQPNPKLFHNLAAADKAGCSDYAWAVAPIIRIRWPKTPNFEFSSDEQVHEFLKKLTKRKRWDLNNIKFDYTFIWRLDVVTQIYFIQVNAIKLMCRDGEAV